MARPRIGQKRREEILAAFQVRLHLGRDGLEMLAH